MIYNLHNCIARYIYGHKAKCICVAIYNCSLFRYIASSKSAIAMCSIAWSLQMFMHTTMCMSCYSAITVATVLTMGNVKSVELLASHDGGMYVLIAM